MAIVSHPDQSLKSLLILSPNCSRNPKPQTGTQPCMNKLLPQPCMKKTRRPTLETGTIAVVPTKHRKTAPTTLHEKKTRRPTLETCTKAVVPTKHGKTAPAAVPNKYPPPIHCYVAHWEFLVDLCDPIKTLANSFSLMPSQTVSVSPRLVTVYGYSVSLPDW